MNFVHHCGAVLLLAATGIGLDTRADAYYHWKDAEGNPMLSDHPPPGGVPYDEQETPYSASPSEVGEVTEITASTDKVDTTAEAPAETNAERCARARANLEALGSADSVTVRNADGSAHTLTPEELQIQRETTRAQIEVYCKE